MALPLWVEFFEELQHVRGRSKNTVMAYRHDLELYEEFKQKKSPISFFYNFLKKKNLSPRSQARVISSVRTYLKFCESHGLKAPELRELHPPRVKTKLPKPLSLEEFQKLYKACKADNIYKTGRNQITLLLLYGLGCRVSELIQLNTYDFNETDGWLKIIGKGQKERLVPLTLELQKELKDYLTHIRPHLLKKDIPSILINDRAQRPSRVDIWRWLAAWSKNAGFQEPINPHRFRHGCATALLEGGADLRSIQMLLGHSSIQTTQIYTSVTTQKIQETIQKHHPLSLEKESY
ncbi:MAG: tyrosine recombinase XerD [Bdellovibrio sp.]|nr:MAG: tyrosine recombinase XerD [Bdellovibrio sp.]